MSKALVIAAEMATYLETLPALAGIDVIVDRQKNIDTEILKAVEKTKGAAVVILYVGGKNTENEGSKGFFRKLINYSVCVHTIPILRDGDAPADDLVEIIEKAMNGWTPANAVHVCYEDMHVKGDEIVPDNSLLIYDIRMALEVQI